MEAFAELKNSVYAALETYSNVHRGSGYNSIVSTHLYELAREIIIEHLGLDKDKYVVIFSNLRRAEILQTQLKSGSYRSLSSQDIGLPLGVKVLAIERKALPKGIPFQAGGGTARLVSSGWVVWAKAPDKLEAGTPAIVNVIAFARALQLIQHFGEGTFQNLDTTKTTCAEKLADNEQSVAAQILYGDELEQYTGRELLDELRKTLIGRGLRVPTAEGIRPFINLDNAASTPTFTPIWEAFCQTWHQPKPVQQTIIQEVKFICSEMLGAPLATYDVIFTSNTTESINLVAESFRSRTEQELKPVVVNTLIEHNSNELPWRTLPGFSLIRLPVDTEGFVDSNELEKLLCAYNQQGKHGKKRITLVTISGASNVLGVFNDLAEISRIVHRYGAHLLVDAAQMVAHRKLDMEAYGIDYLAFSAHKVYAPFGSGVLLAKKGMLHFSSDGLAQIQTSGEENVAGIAALGKALVLLQRIGLELIQAEEQALTGQVLHGLAQIPGLEIYGVKDPNSPKFAQRGGVIVFRTDGLMANEVARELAERGGIGVRYGCHCAHILIKHLLDIHPLLEQFQGLIVTLFPKVSLPGLTRVSLGIENSPDEIDTLIQMLGKINRPPPAGVGNPIASSQTAVHRQIDEFVRNATLKVYGQL